jgi:hypothetical protein
VHKTTIAKGNISSIIFNLAMKKHTKKINQFSLMCINSVLKILPKIFKE